MAITNIATNAATTATPVKKPIIQPNTVLKPETNLPMVQPNTNLPLSNNVAQGAAMQPPPVPQAPVQPDISQDQLLQTARNTVQQGFATPTLDMTSQATQGLLQDPNQGYNPALQKQQNLEQFDLERANALKALGGEMADVSHLGTTIDKLSDVYLSGASERAALSRQSDLDAQALERQNLLQALTEGRATSTAEESRFGTNVSGLTNVIGAGEGAETREFTSAENVLDRTQALLMQSNDIAGNEVLANINNAAAEGRIITQGQINEASASLDRAQEIAVQTNNIEAQKDIEQMRQTLAVQMQESSQAFDEKLKTMDIDAQTSLTELKGKIDSDMLMSSQDFEASQNSIDRELSQALADGDTAKAITLLQMQQDFSDTMQEKQNEYNTTERLATQGWQTGESLSQQEHDKVMQYLDSQSQITLQGNEAEIRTNLAQMGIDADLVMQGNEAEIRTTLEQMGIDANEVFQTRDINSRERIAQQRIDADVSLATQGMEHDEKMAYINSEIANAKANGDMERSKELMTTGFKMDMAKINSEQGFEAAQNEVQNKFELAMQSNAVSYTHLTLPTKRIV